MNFSAHIPERPHTRLPLLLTLALLLTFPSFALARQVSAPEDSSTQDMRTVLAGMDSLSLQQYQRRRALIDALIYSSGLDTNNRSMFISQSRSLLGLAQAIRSDQSYKNVAPIDRDEIARRLNINAADRSQTLDFGAVIRGLLTRAYDKFSNRPKRITDLPIPTPVQMDILNVLWQKGSVTGPEIYQALPKETIITAEMLWRELHRMASNGYVDEKIISPQNTMMIMTPVGGFPVEMSGKNRRNRVYRYTPKIDKETMLHYIDSQRYLAADSTAPALSQIRAKELQELLYKILMADKKAAADSANTSDGHAQPGLKRQRP